MTISTQPTRQLASRMWMLGLILSVGSWISLSSSLSFADDCRVKCLRDYDPIEGEFHPLVRACGGAPTVMGSSKDGQLQKKIANMKRSGYGRVIGAAATRPPSSVDSSTFSSFQSALYDLRIAKTECQKKFSYCQSSCDFNEHSESYEQVKQHLDEGTEMLAKSDTALCTVNPDGCGGGGEVADDGSGDGGVGGAADAPGGSPATDGTSGDTASSGFDMKKMLPLATAAMQMYNQYQQQQAINGDCNGPTPAATCPPRHACFTNPSSLECRCSSFGPGGAECQGAKVTATERYLGNETYGKKYEDPVIDELNSFGSVPQRLPLERKPSVSTAINSPSSIRIGPNSTGETPKKKERRIGTGAGYNAENEKNGAGTSLGYMSQAAVARKVATDPAASGGNGKNRIEQRSYDDDQLRDGAKLHYGKVLEAGLRSVEGRAAYTTTDGRTFSPELRPASDDLFQGIREAYQKRRGTFLN